MHEMRFKTSIDILKRKEPASSHRSFMLIARTHRAEGFEFFVRDEGPIEAEEEYGGVGQHSSEDNQVVHIRAGHLD